MRDSKGRFLRGNQPLNSRDETTGRFIKKSMDSIDQYSMIAEKVDELLKKLETD